MTSAVILTAPLQAGWACKKEEVLGGQVNEEAYIHRYNCQEGYANEMGSILFGSREASIKDILSDPESFEPQTLLSVALIFLGLMTVTFGTSVPSGMFMPTVLTGACLGGYVGKEFQRNLMPSVHPSDFAFLGASAFLNGKQVVVVPIEEKDHQVDIGSLMSKGVFAVFVDTPLSKTCNAFASLGLRHLPVLTPNGRVAGIITRDELSEDRITEVIGRKLKEN